MTSLTTKLIIGTIALLIICAFIVGVIMVFKKTDQPSSDKPIQPTTNPSDKPIQPTTNPSDKQNPANPVVKRYIIQMIDANSNVKFLTRIGSNKIVLTKNKADASTFFINADGSLMTGDNLILNNEIGSGVSVSPIAKFGGFYKTTLLSSSKNAVARLYNAGTATMVTSDPTKMSGFFIGIDDSTLKPGLSPTSELLFLDLSLQFMPASYIGLQSAPILKSGNQVSLILA